MAFRGFIASLSTGETIAQTPDISGELSCWQGLILRCKKEKIKVTQLRLQVNGTTVISRLNAQGYVQCTMARKAMHSKVFLQVAQGIGFVVNDAVVLSWVDDSGNVWQDIAPLSNYLVHAILNT